MKFKNLLITSLFICFGLSLKSQAEIGVNVGLTTFKLISHNEVYPSSKDGFGTGVSISIPIRIHFKEKFIFQPEVNFIQKGQKNLTYNFIEIPLLIKYKLPVSAKHSLEIGLGAGFGKTVGKYYLSGEAKEYVAVPYGIVDSPYETIYIGPSKYNGFDLDAIFDISYLYQLKKVSFVTGLRTQYDFIDPYIWEERAKEWYKDFYGQKRATTSNFGFVTYIGINYTLVD